MVVRILSVNDCEMVMDFIEEIKKHTGQKISKEIFADYLSLRSLVFNSNMVMIGDIEDELLTKLFSAYIPAEDNGISRGLTITSYNNNVEFMKQSLSTLQALLEGRDFTKLKVQLNNERADKESVTKLKSIGFICEAHIKNEKVDRYIYSYFI